MKLLNSIWLIKVVLARLRQATLKMKRSKCCFFFQETNHYLGHLLTTDGKKLHLEKEKAISELNSPTNQKDLGEFLEMVVYYRKFINRFADTVIPLIKLTRRNVKCWWSQDCQTGFEYLKNCLTKNNILKCPDPSKRYVSLQMPQTKQQQLYQHKNSQMRMVK